MTNIKIREATVTDLSYVEALMDEALAPYYGGDHRAHAQRIFGTHISGGKDSLGFFSTEQKMFVLEHDQQPGGIVHLVGKKQATYKISPLIVAREFQGNRGLGSALLEHAESYARAAGARQLYCTVAEENKSALQFFLRKGFTPAGRSYSHYKDGITETMLYKLLVSVDEEQNLDRPHISVAPAVPEYYEQIRHLLLGNLPAHFRDIDSNWVDALFRGYERRDTNDINQKYKLLYAAIDRTGTVLGVAGATPKKGLPIKVMPLIATNLSAFVALTVEIPHLLKIYGRKLYIHLVPTVEETEVLQQHGWKLDAALPAAYHPAHVTQQWSLDLSEAFSMRIMRVKQTYLDLIAKKRKTLEVRVGYNSFKSIQPGERIRLVSHNHEVIIRVNDIRRYPSFDSMLAKEDASRIVPDRSHAEVAQVLKEIYPADRERLGVLVFDITPESTPAHVQARA